MSIFLLKDPDAVFIHIPKNGGTSIRKGAWKSRYQGPVFGRVPDEWSTIFKFAFIRHPLDRLVSAWKMFSEGTQNNLGWEFPTDGVKGLGLPAFLEIVTDERIIYDERRRTYEEKIRHHTIPQTHPFNCLDSADHIGRYETLDQDFCKIMSRLQIRNITLPRLHYTNRGHYLDYFDSHTLEIAIDYYRDDMKLLKYVV